MHVDAIAVVQRTDQPADQHFGTGIHTPDCRHQTGSLEFADIVRHRRPEFGYVPLLMENHGMNYTQRLLLIEDVLAWTGGTFPETEGEINVYIRTSMPTSHDRLKARAVLLRIASHVAHAQRQHAEPDHLLT